MPGLSTSPSCQLSFNMFLHLVRHAHETPLESKWKREREREGHHRRPKTKKRQTLITCWSAFHQVGKHASCMGWERERWVGLCMALLLDEEKCGQELCGSEDLVTPRRGFGFLCKLVGLACLSFTMRVRGNCCCGRASMSSGTMVKNLSSTCLWWLLHLHRNVCYTMRNMWGHRI